MPVPASRNDPCPCGSGRRFKHCHGASAPTAEQRPDEQAERPQRVRALVASGNVADAFAIAARHLAEAPGDLEMLRAYGQAAIALGNVSAARDAWQRVGAVVAEDAEALFQLGNCARIEGLAEEAVRWFEQARARLPRHTGILNNLGLALEAIGRLPEAEQCFVTALDIEPQAFEPLANLAQNLYQQKRYGEAKPYFDTLVRRFDVSHAAIWANRAVCQRQTGDLEGAAQSFRRALSTESSSATLYREFGLLNVELRRFEDAASALEHSLDLDADAPEAQSALLFCRQSLADWRDFDALCDRQREAASGIEHRSQPISPFNFQTIHDDPALQARVAADWIRKRVAVRPSSAVRPRPTERLKLAFVSFDLYDHPVGRLLVGLVERLDRARFDVTLHALGPTRDDRIRWRLKVAATVHETTELDVDAVAARIRAAGTHVAFDLAGFTGRALIELFARRPAPLQINFLGYTGTLGVDAYDCIVADRHCIPEPLAAHYTERPLYIDPCYLPSDPARSTAPAVSRADYGLPEHGLVLCAFANTYKIVPDVFAAWMGLLRTHADAALWLRDAGSTVNERLRREAANAGVAGERLHFAPMEDEARYLGRFRLADLFIDTAPFGSHTVVNDALFAGLPVVTIEGRTFAARASASQLRACGLTDMVAHDIAHYVAIADRWLGDGGARAARRERFRDSVRASALFDMDDYARRFEQALLIAWEQALAATHADGHEPSRGL